jgi:S1-C subfamily serine protease
MLKELNGSQFEELQKSLISAFPTYKKLEAMLLFKLNTNLANIAPQAGLEDVTLELIQWARAEGRLEDLISGAIKHVPNNPELRQFAIALSLTSDETPVRNGSFEAIVLQNSPFEDVVEWRRQMTTIENSICRIEIGGQGIGTGFLVGPGVIITNCHVADLIGDYRQVGIHFDYKANKEGGVNNGRVYQVLENYLLRKSDKNDLDFALIELTEAAGNEVINQTGEKRGWLTPKNYVFQVNEIQIILQHPLAQPMKIGAGIVSQIDNQNHRITYTVHTEIGSSGSPVFNLGWDLVAIHHYGKQTGNIGIPLSTIWKEFEGDRNLLGKLQV